MVMARHTRAMTDIANSHLDLVPEGARIFDRRLLVRRRDRAAAAAEDHDFLFAEAAERLLDRLDDVTRRFPTALDLGCRDGLIARLLRGRGGIAHLVQGELSGALLAQARRHGPVVRLDEEALPFAEASLDLVLASLSLHWVNDLPGALAQIRHALKPDGLFLGVMFGAGTLAELQECLMEAEIAETGGASPRVSPFAELRDAAGLLQRAGFALPVSDVETHTVRYESPLSVMRELKLLGASNPLADRPTKFATLRLIRAASEAYANLATDLDGRVRATLEIVWMSGWAPHESQQKPLKPGSAEISLTKILGTRN
jgi:SAM-dependent methyltransferase